ncbi:MAG TPA: hypothetical protein DDW55_09005, partial [Gammaproteobacteria bacterium]|nr:hypothetical protein [Gammaproteobacteria bacterium]
MKISFSDKHLPVAVVIIIAVVVFIAMDLQRKTPETTIEAQPPEVQSGIARLVNFRDAARAADLAFVLPEWPQTPGQVHQSVDKAIEKSNQLLDKIASIEPYLASFKTTVQAYE